MPALPTIPDVFRVTLNWQAGLIRNHNVLHFSAPSKDSDDVFASLDANVTAAMWSTVFTGGAVGSVDILPLDGSSSTTNYGTGVPAKWSGNGGSDFNSLAPAAIVKLSTGLRGPANRGRVFLPFTTEQDVSQGIVAPAIVTAVSAAWVAFANDMETDGVALGVASYVGAGVWHQALNVGLHNSLGTLGRRQRVLNP